MKLSFHGAARTVTGSKHLLHLNDGRKILLDCGMFQGMGKVTVTLNQEWGFNPVDLTAVIISHAHIDHIGLLPKLVKDGYAGPIFITTPSAQLGAVLMMDSARIQEADIRELNKRRAEHGKEPVEPLYGEEDVQQTLLQFQFVEYNQPEEILSGVRLHYTDSGHILGSAAINLTVLEDGEEVRLTFSGDVGRYNDAILRKPQPFAQADFVILESTYGDRLHPLATGTADDILEYIRHTCLDKKGKLIIPAFSVGRTQEILYFLNRLSLERRLPELKYYVDSPLSIKATEIVKRHPECFNERTQELLEKDDDVFSFPGLHYIQEAEDSMAIDQHDEPCVIIASSGMAEAGRVKHHIARHIHDSAHTIMIVGYCEPNSLGGKLRDGAKNVTIYGRDFEVRAEVGAIQSMSAHGDYEDLMHWLSCQEKESIQKIFLVHGEPGVQEIFRGKLVAHGYNDVAIPNLHETFDLTRKEEVEASAVIELPEG